MPTIELTIEIKKGKTAIVTVDETGEIKLETKGFKGKSCIDETKFIKELLGEEISRELKPTYYMRDKEVVRRHLPLCG